MNYITILKSIPKEYRDEILKTNMIAEAQGIPSDPNTHYLHTIWRNYIDSGIGDCGLCYQNTLTNFRKMQQSMVELSVQEELLKEI